MIGIAAIKSCRDITEAHIAEALETRDDTRALLEHAAHVAKPRAAGSRVLLVYARMATPSCDWLDGALRVELRGEEHGTTIEAYAEIGGGLKERVFPALHTKVPIEEFVAAIKKFPKAIEPLALERPSPTHLVLRAGEAARRDEDEDTKKKPSPRVPTPIALSAGDLPTVGDAPDTAAAEAQPLARIKLRKQQLPVAIREEGPPRKIPKRTQVSIAKPPIAKPPPEPAEPPEPAAETADAAQKKEDDVDEKW